MDVEVKSINLEAKSKVSVSAKAVRLTKRCLKILPMTMAALCLCNTVLSFFYIDLPIISYLVGVGFLPWTFILLASYCFRFCEYHRMFLWYIFVNNIVCIADEEIGLPIATRDLFILHIILAGIFMFLVLYFRLKCK